MPIGSISSVNFQGRNSQLPAVLKPEVIDVEEGGYKVLDPREKANQNVHIATVGIAGATTLAAALKGKKYVGVAGKAITTAGEAIANGFVKVVSKFASAVKTKVLKKPQGVDSQKVLGKIKTIADNLRNDKETKMVSNIERIAEKILGNKEKAGKVGEFLRKIDVVNPVKALNAGIAATLAIIGGDKLADKVEQNLDKEDVKEAMKNLGELGEIIFTD